jgi:phage baseplate assembly protein W
MIDEGRLLGRGFHFPPRINAQGRWEWSSGSQNIRQAIRVILQTEPLERLMLPEFGGGLKQLLFQPNATATHRLIEEIVTQALKRWEPRIQLDSIQVDADPAETQMAMVTIRYSLVTNKQSDQMQLRVLLSG